jgi:hypothetical protein
MEAASLEQLKTAVNALLGTGLLGVVCVLCLGITYYTVRLLLSVQTTASAEKDKLLEKAWNVQQEMQTTYAKLEGTLLRTQEVAKDSLRHSEETSRSLQSMVQNAQASQVLMESALKRMETEIQTYGSVLQEIRKAQMIEPLRDSQFDLERQIEVERQKMLGPDKPLPGIPPYNSQKHR